MAEPGGGGGGSGGRKEIYTYDAPWCIYAMGWCQKSDPGDRYRLAVGSFTEEYNNKVQIVQRTETSFVRTGELDHPYPPTKIMWSPDKSQGGTDLLATTGDYLRLWSVDEQEPGGVKLHSLLNNNTNAEYCSPLTSFDWCEADPSTVGTSSIDTTCTIWDVTYNGLEMFLEKGFGKEVSTLRSGLGDIITFPAKDRGTPKTQLIAHDKEVYDIAFARTKDIFASVGADGSVRMFDLRSLEHSTIIYETHDLTPLMRLSWNKQDPNYLATILTDSAKTVILDIRVPSLPVAILGGHQASVNAIAWAPHSSCHICTAGDDCQSLIWDLSSVPSSVPKAVEDPILAYTAEEEVNQLQWSASHPEWIAIAFANKMQILRV